MNQINSTSGINNEIASELEEIRALAAQPRGGVRMLQEMELGWVSGGDGPVGWV